MSIVNVIVPVSGSFSDETFNVNLGGTLYTCDFVYNFEGQFWVFTLTLNSVILFYRAKVVQGVNIGQIFNAETKVAGKFFVQSTSGNMTDPVFGDFGLGLDQQLIYQYDDGR